MKDIRMIKRLSILWAEENYELFTPTVHLNYFAEFRANELNEEAIVRLNQAEKEREEENVFVVAEDGMCACVSLCICVWECW